MGAQTIPLRVASGDPQEVAKSIDLDDRWRRAEEKGLLMKQVLMDPDDPSRLELHLRWTSLDAAREFQSDVGDAFDFGDQVTAEKPKEMVTAGRFQGKPERR